MTAINKLKVLHVAVGVIRNDSDEILIARRNSQQHQGGKWEFPGGKVEQGENVSTALARELKEELGIEVKHDQPLCQIRHCYPDRHVFLEVREVTRFSGKPIGLEGQPLQWLAASEMDPGIFPAANQAIVRAARLPRNIAIINNSHDAEQDWPSVIAGFSALPPQCWLRLRAITGSTPSQYLQKTKDFLISSTRNRPLLIDLDVSLQSIAELEALREKVLGLGLPGWGYYANKQVLAAMSEQRPPLLENITIGASCHNQQEYQLAVDKGMDFVIASPVASSTSHPENPGMGWRAFAAIAKTGMMPCFAMGGLSQQDYHLARQSAAYGIAGISLYR
ncbi:hypothetical protein GCM10011403_22520 [Pseudohongiella nitratireducens]|uniref:8-oxo-dGTP diphosphatase n=1 Tax=Pseudohongiella nitratireducens TaxID=1768907 RepID=A0A916QLV5_9GAMM|nr:Nudix family hydrolase [Pseudohongiella nitratireducens]MDF1623044.1 Nudix family hydrolase [Pseudohongiella nitratireducens]GFZ78874.1 hypothetical protein GCM10011403_22520 [Pseudohongiella nitratireducens]